MADVNLTQRDIDYISRVVDTEVPRSLQRRNPEEYGRMVRAVVDTVTNRMASGQFPSTATGVLNQSRQFSKITGPKRLDPYGSVQNTPKAPSSVRNIVADHVASRAAGSPPTIGGSLNYANPNFSSKSNLGWVNDMISAGAQKLGIGKNVHYHGNAPGTQPVGQYSVAAEGMPGRFVATPTPRGALTQSQQTTGIMAAVDPIARGVVTRSDLPASATAYAAVRNPYDKLREDLLKQKAELEANKRVGGINPFAEPEQPRKYSVAEQYALYGQGQAAARNLGLLAQDVAAQPSQTYPVNEAVPQSVTAYAPSAATPQVSSVSGPAGAGGLLSPEEQEMFEAQRANLSSQPLNSNLGMKVGNFAKGALGSIGGGLLGSALLGPVGGLIGAAIGNSAMNGAINRGVTGFPEAPKSKSRGDGKETAYGRSVRESSAQYDRAAKSGRAGLY